MVIDLIYMGKKLPKGIKKINFETACDELVWEYFRAHEFIFVYDNPSSIGETPSSAELKKLLAKFQEKVKEGKFVLARYKVMKV